MLQLHLGGQQVYSLYQNATYIRGLTVRLYKAICICNLMVAVSVARLWYNERILSNQTGVPEQFASVLCDSDATPVTSDHT